MNKKAVIIVSILSILLIGLSLRVFIPLAIKEHNLNKIKNQIELLENQIEYNKQQWLNCDTNMKLWNEENDEKRETLKELKTDYNNIVGFIEEVSQPIKSDLQSEPNSPITLT
jgi:septal ring factor EnvC (AmiA/AmiB activator)